MITLTTSAEELLSNLPEGTTGLLIGDEYIPFSAIEKVEGNVIWLKSENGEKAT